MIWMHFRVLMGTNDRKGRLVEQIAARMHQASGVEVKTRVMLPPITGRGDPSEIDILLTTRAAGYPVSLAVECKNERKPIGRPYIDAFVGKLKYVGIPTSLGIFISASRYTQPAIERAQAAGIKLLTLTGIDRNGITVAVGEAFQSVVFLLLQVGEFSVTSEAPPGMETFPICWDREGRPVGTVFDLIVDRWRTEDILSRLGEHKLNLDVPDDWVWRQGETAYKVFSATATVYVYAHVFRIKGEATQHLLVSQPTDDVERGEIQARWNEDHDAVSLIGVENEEELVRVLKEHTGQVHLVVQRVRLPRILTPTIFGRMYWPPSEKAWRRLYAIREAQARGEQIVDEESIEGTEFQTIFEPAWDGYPRYRSSG